MKRRAALLLAAFISGCVTQRRDRVKPRLEDLLSELSRKHQIYPPASGADLLKAEKFGLPDDLLAFYRFSDGACIHRVERGRGLVEDEDHGWLWLLLPIWRPRVN